MNNQKQPIGVSLKHQERPKNIEVFVDRDKEGCLFGRLAVLQKTTYTIPFSDERNIRQFVQDILNEHLPDHGLTTDGEVVTPEITLGPRIVQEGTDRLIHGLKT